MTRDIDFIIHLEAKNVDFFVNSFKDRFYCDPYRLEEFNRRLRVTYFGKTIYVVSPEDLLLSKLIWIQDFQSAIQIEDIKNLAVVDNLDRAYISKWIRQLNLRTFNLID